MTKVDRLPSEDLFNRRQCQISSPYTWSWRTSAPCSPFVCLLARYIQKDLSSRRTVEGEYLFLDWERETKTLGEAEIELLTNVLENQRIKSFSMTYYFPELCNRKEPSTL